MGPWRLAIDFGTTNTAAAMLRDGTALPLRLSSSADQMPSGVLARPDGTLLVGESAANEAAMYLDSYEPNPKYRLGDEAVYLGQRDWSPIELVAAVLERVGDKARATTGEPVDDAVVLTHPAAWSAHKRDRLRDAALLAGFEQVRLVSEPVAAARWYASRPATNGNGSGDPGVIDSGATIAVFDFGGGTCDVAVLRAADGRAEHFEVLASGGDDYLGGEEIDRVLMEWAVDEVVDTVDRDAAARIEEARTGREWFTFHDAVRRAKHTLSEAETATVPFSLGTTSRSLPIRREQFDALVAPHLDRAMDLTQRVLDAADTTPDALAELPGDTAAMYLTGGSATIPVLHERMQGLLDRPAARLDDPKTVVPRGALIAPEVHVDEVTNPLRASSEAAPSLVQDELVERRRIEVDTRPDRDDDKLPRRIEELEAQVVGLRAALEQRDRAAARQQAPVPVPAAREPPTERVQDSSPAPRRAAPPTRTAGQQARPRQRRRRGVGRILLGIVLLAVAVGLGLLGRQVLQDVEHVPILYELANGDHSHDQYFQLGRILLGLAVASLVAGLLALRGRR